MSVYYCVECGEECDVEWEDEGIGAYEYWGSKETHEAWVPSSVCCGSEVSETPIEVCDVE